MHCKRPNNKRHWSNPTWTIQHFVMEILSGHTIHASMCIRSLSVRHPEHPERCTWSYNNTDMYLSYICIIVWSFVHTLSVGSCKGLLTQHFSACPLAGVTGLGGHSGVEHSVHGTGRGSPSLCRWVGGGGGLSLAEGRKSHAHVNARVCAANWQQLSNWIGLAESKFNSGCFVHISAETYICIYMCTNVLALYSSVGVYAIVCVAHGVMRSTWSDV